LPPPSLCGFSTHFDPSAIAVYVITRKYIIVMLISVESARIKKRPIQTESERNWEYVYKEKYIQRNKYINKDFKTETETERDIDR